MKEIIESIHEIGDESDKPPEVNSWDWPPDQGYAIKTNLHEYILTISGGQSCCESVGKLSTEDELDDFIGAELQSIQFIELGSYNAKELLEKISEHSLPDIAFVNILTTKGLLQLAVYNWHNGYYGHTVVFKKDEEITEAIC
jgi:hypothetical protein